MSQQVVIFNNEFSMSSYEFLTEIINPARVAYYREGDR